MKYRPPNLPELLVAVSLCALAACSAEDSDQTDRATPGEVAAPAPAEAEPFPEAPEPAADTAAAEPERDTAASGADAAAPQADVEQAAAQAAGAREPRTQVVTALVTAFDPIVVFVEPGDTVRWTNMTGHDTESIAGMIPEGAKAWQSQLGQEFTVTLTVPGAYVYKCNPHVSLGMVASIVVGPVPPANLEAIQAHPENRSMIGRAIRKLVQALETGGQ